MPQKANLSRLLSRNDAKLYLAGLSILVGIVAGLIVTLFRFVLENGFPLITNGLATENFEALNPLNRFLLPLIGCLLIAVIFHVCKPQAGSIGVAYVINKVRNFRGFMPIKNAVIQFVGATLALLSGGSCGQEGPAIHIGATSGSALGYSLNLPNNSVRTLIACGSAAAISASFNTPIAGVIFAMEVIMMEYAISSFIPVIIASVSAAVITQIFYGGEPVFDIASTRMISLWEIPYVAFIGILLGALSSIFVRLHKFASSFNHIDQRIRLLITGLLTGSLALFVPEIMGMGYDTLNLALQENLALPFLSLLLISKLIVTAIGLGLGLPGGIIGPTIMMGGIAGAIMGSIGALFFPSDPAFYVLLGMCAMMGATLQAPLAALMALLELSNNPNIILPAMIIIVVANLTFSEILKSKSVLLIQQDENSAANKELARFLNRYGVSTLLNSNFQTISPDMEFVTLEEQLQDATEWLIIDHESEHKTIISRKSLNSGYENLGQFLANSDHEQKIIAISQRATLQEALETLQEAELKYAYIYTINKQAPFITGVISIDDIINFYHD